MRKTRFLTFYCRFEIPKVNWVGHSRFRFNSTCLIKSFITRSLFHSRLKTFLFRKSFPPQPFLFFFRTDSADSPDCLPILVTISVFYFLVFFPLLVVGSVRSIKLTHDGYSFLAGSLPLSNLYMYLLCSDMVNKLISLSYWFHVKIAPRIVSQVIKYSVYTSSWRKILGVEWTDSTERRQACSREDCTRRRADVENNKPDTDLRRFWPVQCWDRILCRAVNCSM